jgi:pilus assembly protein CpaE
VVLVDADVQFGDVATALSLTPAHTLPDAVTDAAKLDTMVLKTYLTPHESGFYTVCGADTPVDGDRVTGEQLSHLIRQLSEVFRFVVIDTAPGLGDHALAALELATDAVIVCDMSVPSARGLRKELAALASIGIIPPTRHVVLNLGDRSSGLSVRDIEATIGVPIDIAIRRSKLVALSTNRGVPVLADGSRDSASKALTALVRRFDPTAARKHGRLHRRVVVA